jgi:hypothetical protein
MSGNIRLRGMSEAFPTAKVFVEKSIRRVCRPSASRRPEEETQQQLNFPTMKTAEPHHHRRIGPAWITVGTFNQLEDARNLAQFLTDEGIPSEVKDERRLQKAWFWTKPQAGVHVTVAERNVERARQFLETNPIGAELMEPAIRCPSCHSARVQYPAMTRKNILPALMAQMFVLTHITRHECYCENCHYTWIPGEEGTGESS